MTKTLILAVDRDDDFGEKGGVETPVIGIEKATQAAIALGTADPEDSDVNGLFAAMNIYKELTEDGKDVEIALICGDKKVGHRSDSALVDELIEVLDIVKPDRSILVGDGAEDEVIYPIISSRVPVDSVKKVYVKQAPGLEGSYYIFSKMLSDPQKRKRFLVPIGLLVFAIAFIYFAIDLTAFTITDNADHLFAMSAPIVGMVIGAIILMYGYNSMDRLVAYIDEWKEKVMGSSVSATFMVLSLAMFIVGIILGVFAVKNFMGNGFIYVSLVFVTNVIWPFSFAYFFIEMGRMLDEYIENKHLSRHFMTSSIMMFGIAFVIQGAIDFVRNYVGFGTYSNGVMLIELTVGVMFMLIASIIHVSYKKHFINLGEADPDEI